MTATILVVDDLEQNIKLLEAKLLAEYYIVLTASSGKDAIEILSKNQVDVVLLDGMMPGMDGFETCKLIKSNPDTTHIPVVMVTALSDIEDRIKGLEAGADEFLTKPVDDVALFARVNSLSRTKSVIDELKLRNKTNLALGANVVEFADDFSNTQFVIIDDDVVQAKNISKILAKISSKIHITKDASNLDSLDGEVDLVIISCQMDGVDPLRLLSSLRIVDKLKKSVFMFLAEDENMKFVIKGLEFGISDYFIYPVDENELLARVRTQLRRKKYQDILRNQLDQSINLSVKDGLTGIYNRRYFDSHIEQLIEKFKDSTAKLSLVIIDIDHFKDVNDKYGHQAGDEVLKSMSDFFNKNIREVDFFARYGGEEFVLLYSSVPGSLAMDLSNRLREKLKEFEIKINDKESIRKTVSMGVAEYKEGETSADFIARADKALYSAKETGRDKVVLAS